MKDADKTKEALISELTGLCQWVAELEKTKENHHLMEETLRQNDGKYHSIFDHALAGIFRSTTGGKLIEVNPEATRMVGMILPKRLLWSPLMAGQSSQ
jgi:PAS domain-containing protein